MVRVPPILFIVALLWVIIEAAFGGPVGIPPVGFRIVAGLLAAVIAVAVVFITAADWVGGVQNM